MTASPEGRRVEVVEHHLRRGDPLREIDLDTVVADSTLSPQGGRRFSAGIKVVLHDFGLPPRDLSVYSLFTPNDSYLTDGLRYPMAQSPTFVGWKNKDMERQDERWRMLPRSSELIVSVPHPEHAGAPLGNNTEVSVMAGYRNQLAILGLARVESLLQVTFYPHHPDAEGVTLAYKQMA